MVHCIVCGEGPCVTRGKRKPAMRAHYRALLRDAGTHAVFTTLKQYHSEQLRGKKKCEWKRIVSKRLVLPAKAILHCSLGGKPRGGRKLVGDVNGIVTISAIKKFKPGERRPFKQYDVKYVFGGPVVRFEHPFEWKGDVGVNPVSAERVDAMADGLLANSPVTYSEARRAK